MAVIGVYVPTLGRPQALARVVDNIHAATSSPCEVVFVTEPHDPESYEAALATDAGSVLINRYESSYSNALQTAYEICDHRYFIGANDDFDFQPGWDTAALERMVDGIHVVGLNDGAPGCQFSTISLVRRSYIRKQSGVIGMRNRVNYPYRHNYVDTEFYCTAVHRGVFAAAPDSHVHHKHPDWGFAADDDTYRKSRASMGEDSATFQSRAHLWTT